MQGIGLPEHIVAAIEQKDFDNPLICESMNHKFTLNPEILINRLSFTHFRELLTIVRKYRK